MRAPLVAALLLPVPAVAAAALARSGDVRTQVRAWREAHAGQVVSELAALVALPNVASDAVAIRRNADAIVTMLERRGIAARLLEVEGSPPAVYGELLDSGRAPHADGLRPLRRPARRTRAVGGRPVDSGPARRPAREAAGARSPSTKADGRTDGEWRLYGRSTSDDKAPIVGVLAALDALRAAGIPPSVNLKLFFEGEEEAGSPHLQAMLAQHADRLKADVWVFCDGPVHQSRRLQLFWGVRGVMGLEMTVYGPLRSAAQRPLRQLGAQSRGHPRPPRRQPARHRRPDPGRRVLRRRAAALGHGEGRGGRGPRRRSGAARRSRPRRDGAGAARRSGSCCRR